MCEYKIKWDLREKKRIKKRFSPTWWINQIAHDLHLKNPSKQVKKILGGIKKVKFIKK